MRVETGKPDYIPHRHCQNVLSPKDNSGIPETPFVSIRSTHPRHLQTEDNVRSNDEANKNAFMLARHGELLYHRDSQPANEKGFGFFEFADLPLSPSRWLHLGTKGEKQSARPGFSGCRPISGGRKEEYATHKSSLLDM
jgi:hypothetical protein